MINPPAFRSSCLLSFLFPLQECGSHWCRWRPDCATYCHASRWRHAKRRLCVLLLKINLSCWRRKGKFDCPSRECSPEIIYIYIYMYIYTHIHIYIYTYTCTIHLKYRHKYLLNNFARRSPLRDASIFSASMKLQCALQLQHFWSLDPT